MATALHLGALEESRPWSEAAFNNPYPPPLVTRSRSFSDLGSRFFRTRRVNARFSPQSRWRGGPMDEHRPRTIDGNSSQPGSLRKRLLANCERGHIVTTTGDRPTVRLHRFGGGVDPRLAIVAGQHLCGGIVVHWPSRLGVQGDRAS